MSDFAPELSLVVAVSDPRERRRWLTFTGYLADEDLAQLNSAAEVVALPTFDDGFGLTAVEAMASGTAVVASDRGSLPEVLGDAGTFFDPNSVESLRLTLAELLPDERGRATMRELGLRRATNYTWDKSAQALEDVLAELG